MVSEWLCERYGRDGWQREAVDAGCSQVRTETEAVVDQIVAHCKHRLVHTQGIAVRLQALAHEMFSETGLGFCVATGKAKVRHASLLQVSLSIYLHCIVRYVMGCGCAVVFR